MKKVLPPLIFAITVLTLCGCGSIRVDSLTITKALRIENTTSDQLYIRANNWMVDVFHNAEHVIQFSDKEGGVVSGRYYLGKVVSNLVFDVDDIIWKKVYAIIKIRVKDGAAKISITSQSYSYSETSGRELEVEEKIDDLIYDFELAMNKEEDNNW